MNRYLTEALASGQAPKPDAIVAELVHGSQGLGRLDLRTFGVVKVNCSAGYTDSTVTINGAEAAGCSKRIFLASGTPEIAVVSKGVQLCKTRVTLAMQEEKVCECAIGQTPGSSSLKC